MKHQLKENEDLKRAMRVDSHIKAFEAYAADPKNAPELQTPEFKAMAAQVENYRKTGNVNGIAGEINEFKFIAPEEIQDTNAYLREFANKVEYHGFEKGANESVRQFVLDSDKDRAVMDVLSSKMGRYITKEWDKLDDAEKKRHGGIEKWTRQRMEPYFQGQKYEKGHAPQRSSSFGGFGGLSGVRSLWKEAVNNGYSAFGQPVAADPNGIKRILADESGAFKLDGVEIGIPGSSNRKLVNFGVTKNVTTSGSKIMVTGNPQNPRIYASATARLPYDQFESHFPDAIDKATFGWTSIFGKDQLNDGLDKKGYSLTTDEEGNKWVQFDFWKPIDHNNSSIDAAYDHAINGKTEEYNSASGSDGRMEASQGDLKKLVAQYGEEQVRQAMADGLLVVK
jgi:hypothetical protein